MEKYSIFNLYVITIDGQKFICESILPGKEYKEILTRRKIDFKEEYTVEKLSDYYRLIGHMNHTTREPMILSRNNVLDKYIEINMPPVEDEHYEEKLSLLISETVENPDLFYKRIGDELTPEEREHIKSFLPKSCDTCSNGCCRVEQVDKPVHNCIAWENDRIVGQYKVLKLNRISNNSTK